MATGRNNHSAEVYFTVHHITNYHFFSTTKRHLFSAGPCLAVALREKGNKLQGTGGQAFIVLVWGQTLG